MQAQAASTVRNWSGQQDAIFTEWVDGTGNVVVIARAGTGKTTTIVEAVIRRAKRYPNNRVVVCAFNKRIADELTTRFVAAGVRNVEVKTLHSLGYAAVRRAWENVRLEPKDQQGLRADTLAGHVCGTRVPDHVVRLVSKLHSKAREITPHATTVAEVIDLAYTFECVPDESWESSGFDVEYVCTKALEAMELAATNRQMANATGIDFSDMIFLPVRNRWLFAYADDVVVDEAQDMTVAQLEIAQGICKGRMMVVGDNRQAIYAFRGADSESLSRLQRELNAQVFPLNITYRCGLAIVAEAQRLVADFQAGPSNPAGVIETIAAEKLIATAGHGDFVLSRLNAPLVSVAIGLLRSGKRARVAGRDIGKGLLALVRKLAKGAAANSVPEFLERVEGWRSREVTRLEAAKKTSRIEAINDQAEMLIEMASNANSVRDVEARIDALFTDDGLGQAGVITCSSVHRAKGLEAERVFVLKGTLYRMGVTTEEENIEYVAITRAKQTLVWVA